MLEISGHLYIEISTSYSKYEILILVSFLASSTCKILTNFEDHVLILSSPKYFLRVNLSSRISEEFVPIYIALNN